MKLLGMTMVLAMLTGIGITHAVAAGNVSAQAVASGIPHDFLYGLSFEGKHGIAVGDHGLLMDTADGGATWRKLDKSGVKDGLFSVVRKSGKCMAAGQQGSIVRSDDCIKWANVPPVTNARMLSIHANSKGNAYAVGEFGALLKSSDWGASWNQLAVDWKSILGTEAEPHLYSVNVGEDGSVIVTGEFELIIRSTDGGLNWGVLHKGERSLFGIHVGENGRMLAVGQEGLILRSVNDGKSWTPIKSGTSAILTDVWSSPDGQDAIAVGIRTVVTSTDSGLTFSPEVSKTTTRGMHSAVKGIEGAEGARTAFVAGSAGEILKLTF